MLLPQLSSADLTKVPHEDRRGQWLYPVVENGALAGVVTRMDLRTFASGSDPNARIADVMRKDPLVAYADEPLRAVVYRMAETGITRFPVIDGENSRKLIGLVSLQDLLRARVRNLEEERQRERVLRIRLPFMRPRVAEAERSPEFETAGTPSEIGLPCNGNSDPADRS
ncbi:MAG TPA: CBS domain-containing protein [Bryobacteraceae bacterium]